MDISQHKAIPISILDHLARTALGDATSGVSAGTQVTIHLLDTRPAYQDIAHAILDGYDSVTIQSSATVMQEGDPDPTITVNSTDDELGYIVLLDGEAYSLGDVIVTGGQATLSLNNPIAGDYHIVVYRKQGDYRSGTITISVQEAI